MEISMLNGAMRKWQPWLWTAWLLGFVGLSGLLSGRAIAQGSLDSAEDLDLDPIILEESPVLQRWLDEVPDLAEDIRHDPSFRPRLRVGYAQWLSDPDASGFYLGVEDVLIQPRGLTLSADYQGSFGGDRQAYGLDLRYYLRPLGSYVNVAPVVGYRSVEREGDRRHGPHVGLRVLLALSRTGAADLALSQTWVNPGGSQEVSLTTLSAGYAVTSDLRISTDLQWQRARQSDRRVGIGLEWMF